MEGGLKTIKGVICWDFVKRRLSDKGLLEKKNHKALRAKWACMRKPRINRRASPAERSGGSAAQRQRKDRGAKDLQPDADEKWQVGADKPLGEEPLPEDEEAALEAEELHDEDLLSAEDAEEPLLGEAAAALGPYRLAGAAQLATGAERAFGATTQSALRPSFLRPAPDYGHFWPDTSTKATGSLTQAPAVCFAPPRPLTGAAAAYALGLGYTSATFGYHSLPEKELFDIHVGYNYPPPFSLGRSMRACVDVSADAPAQHAELRGAVLSANGEWADVPLTADQVAVLPGALLQQATGSLIAPALHRKDRPAETGAGLPLQGMPSASLTTPRLLHATGKQIDAKWLQPMTVAQHVAAWHVTHKSVYRRASEEPITVARAGGKRKRASDEEAAAGGPPTDEHMMRICVNTPRSGCTQSGDVLSGDVLSLIKDHAGD
ncbi:hypothetical protein WJX81_006666 [Elliptochloris bilobata]|uniref:Uncharacterized protein n=1 Tax=Elliptochloris bilobata TaxID=381761 RepID=A0AAW1S447_9CHLO